jgi:hypothetical protein
MISDTRYLFESDAFPPVPGEDDETNPGICGRALAAWLADALGLAGYVVERIVAEDFGRVLVLAHPGCRLHVAVASTDESGRAWQVFAFAEYGLLARLRRSSGDASAISQLMSDLKRVLEESADVKSLREAPT